MENLCSTFNSKYLSPFSAKNLYLCNLFQYHYGKYHYKRSTNRKGFNGVH